MPSGRNIKDSSEDEEAGAAEADTADEAEGEEDLDDEEVVEKGSRSAARAAKRSGPRSDGRTGWQRFKARFRDVRFGIYIAFFGAAIVTMVLGVVSLWFRRALGPWFEDRFNEMGAWNTWLFILGLGLILVASYLFLTLTYKKAEFARLVSTKSKGDFVHSLDRIERLAFELGSRENEIVAARKRDFKIRH